MTLGSSAAVKRNIPDADPIRLGISAIAWAPTVPLCRSSERAVKISPSDDRLYYRDSFLYDFDAEVRELTDFSRARSCLDRSCLLSHERRSDLRHRHYFTDPDPANAGHRSCRHRRWPHRPLSRGAAQRRKTWHTRSRESISSRRRDHMQQRPDSMFSGGFIGLSTSTPCRSIWRTTTARSTSIRPR